MKTVSNKKKALTSFDIAFLLTLCILSVHTILLLFSVFNLIAYAQVSHITCFLCVFCSLLVLLIVLLISKKRNIKASSFFVWFHLCCLLLFANIFVTFGLYAYIYIQVLCAIYIAFLFSNFGISLYFHFSQDKGTLFVKNYGFAIIQIFALSFMFAGFSFCIGCILSLCQVLTFSYLALYTFIVTVALLLQMLLFYLSLCKTKKYVNACLIKKSY